MKVAIIIDMDLSIFLYFPLTLTHTRIPLMPSPLHCIVDCRASKSWMLQYSLRRDGANLETLLHLCATTDIRGIVQCSAAPCTLCSTLDAVHCPVVVFDAVWYRRVLYNRCDAMP